MKTSHTYVYLILFLAMTQTVVAKNQYEKEVDVSRFNFSDSTSLTQVTSARLTYYLESIQFGNFPYAEAAFVQRESYLSGQGTYQIRDYSLDSLVSKRGVIGGAFAPKNLPMVLIGNYQNTISDGNINDLQLDYESEDFYGETIFYIAPTTAISANFLYAFTDRFEDDLLTDQYEYHEAGLRFKHLTAVNSSQFISLNTRLFAERAVTRSITFQEELTVHTFTGAIDLKYYFSKGFSINIGLQKDRVRNEENEGGWLRSMELSYFYQNTTNIIFEINEYKGDDGNANWDYDAVAFRLQHRF